MHEEVDPRVDKERQALGGESTLTDKDIAELGAGTLQVYRLMCDGQWHSPEAICRVAGHPGHPATEGLRRMRVLRRWYIVEKRRVAEGRLWHYRLCDLTTGSSVQESHRQVVAQRQMDLRFAMGGNSHGQSMYEQVEDTEPKATVTAEQVEAANKAAEAAVAQAKADLVDDKTGASST
jgi:hypothetical protein